MKKMRINCSIYSIETIKKAIDAYQGYATISIILEKNYVILTFNDCKYDEDITIKEFENYMIGIENS